MYRQRRRASSGQQPHGGRADRALVDGESVRQDERARVAPARSTPIAGTDVLNDIWPRGTGILTPGHDFGPREELS